jgi:GTPase SAR1 family protein
MNVRLLFLITDRARNSPIQVDAAGKFNEIMNTVEIDGRSVRLDVQQEPYGQYEHDIQYVDASVILICFAIDRVESLKSVSDKWIPEVLYHCSQAPVPYILVGCKSDVRKGGADLEGNGVRIVSVEEAQAAARKVGAVGYMECSALIGKGISELLQYVAGVTISNDNWRRDGKCIIV